MVSFKYNKRHQVSENCLLKLGRLYIDNFITHCNHLGLPNSVRGNQGKLVFCSIIKQHTKHFRGVTR